MTIQLIILFAIIAVGLWAANKTGRMDANRDWRQWEDDNRYGYAPDGKDALGLTRKQRTSDKA